MVVDQNELAVDDYKAEDFLYEYENANDSRIKNNAENKNERMNVWMVEGADNRMNKL